ncbi:uncharacterized protein DS421_5g165500 [Arachis hypogaea]|nr:uncharacterized protein DS421_5g165500 [Arachis hypogaea]
MTDAATEVAALAAVFELKHGGSSKGFTLRAPPPATSTPSFPFAARRDGRREWSICDATAETSCDDAETVETTVGPDLTAEVTQLEEESD